MVRGNAGNLLTSPGVDCGNQPLKSWLTRDATGLSNGETSHTPGVVCLAVWLPWLQLLRRLYWLPLAVVAGVSAGDGGVLICNDIHILYYIQYIQAISLHEKVAAPQELSLFFRGLFPVCF